MFTNLLSEEILSLSHGKYKTMLFLNIKPEIAPWTGRFYSLLDPSYAKNHIPIIASVSEHQPTTWSSFYFDLQMLVFLFPGRFCHLVFGLLSVMKLQ